MKYIKILPIILGVVFLGSCIKHEVIPKPKYVATLPASFTANIQGVHYEIIEDVKGFYPKTDQAKDLLPSPQPSSIIYYSSLKSDQVTDMIQIRLGKLFFSSNNKNTPSVDEFYEYFENDIPSPITYKEGSDDGVEIWFVDSQGILWESAESSGLPQDFQLTNIEPDADDDGTYLKFVARFNLSLYDDIDNPNLSDTITIENATYEGYFKR